MRDIIKDVAKKLLKDYPNDKRRNDIINSLFSEEDARDIKMYLIEII